MRQLLFLGTAFGMPQHSACSSLLVEEGKTHMLIDVGGGHELLGQFWKAGKDPGDIQTVFISHYDSDHILGIVPLIRAFARDKTKKRRKLFCSQDVKAAIESLFTYVSKKKYDEVLPWLEIVVVKDRMIIREGDWQLTFFDLQSTKSPQFGCVIQCADKTRVSFLGDEPLKDHVMDLVRESDILIHEAFCLDGQKDQFKPHEKNHGTVKEAAQHAARARAKTLVLHHMEDVTLATRKETYAREAKTFFSGNVIVPVDLDQFTF